MGFGYLVGKMKQIYIPVFICLFSFIIFAFDQYARFYLSSYNNFAIYLNLSIGVFIIFYIILFFKGIKYFGDIEIALDKNKNGA